MKHISQLHNKSKFNFKMLYLLKPFVTNLIALHFYFIFLICFHLQYGYLSTSPLPGIRPHSTLPLSHSQPTLTLPQPLIPPPTPSQPSTISLNQLILTFSVCMLNNASNSRYFEGFATVIN